MFSIGNASKNTSFSTWHFYNPLQISFLYKPRIGLLMLEFESGHGRLSSHSWIPNFLFKRQRPNFHFRRFQRIIAFPSFPNDAEEVSVFCWLRVIRAIQVGFKTSTSRRFTITWDLIPRGSNIFALEQN